MNISLRYRVSSARLLLTRTSQLRPCATSISLCNQDRSPISKSPQLIQIMLRELVKLKTSHVTPDTVKNSTVKLWVSLNVDLGTGRFELWNARFVARK